MAATDAKNLRRVLLDLFAVLDTPLDKRDRYLEPELAAFPYVNGGLFRAHGQDARATSVTGVSPVHDDEIPPLTDEIKELLSGSSDFDWSGISPTIFGAVFESTLNPDTRRKGGMHYTSVANIHKVIDPLFMDELERRFGEILGETARPESSPYHSTPVGAALRAARSPSLCELNKKQRQALLALQDEISKLTFLDPACGSGNFLTETYLSLRRLENRIIAALQRGQSELDLGQAIKVSIHQFHGIEINDFAAEVARTALWIAEAQMLRETEAILHRNFDFLPLKSYADIVCGNALRLDWGSLISHRDTETQRDGEESLRGSVPPWETQKQFDYIMGNPPFVGFTYMSAEQKADMLALFPKNKNLDFVCGWYKKAWECIFNAEAQRRREAQSDSRNLCEPPRLCDSALKQTKCAFVSTNSITQGEQVAVLWKNLPGMKIDFAYRTFKWHNEARGIAAVHCVIIGFSARDDFNAEAQRRRATQSGSENLCEPPRLCVSALKTKTIFDELGEPHKATNINGYLMDAPDVLMESRNKPLCDVPRMVYGNKPTDGGNLLLSPEERDALLAAEPQAAPLIRPFLGADEFINRSERYCLWLVDASPVLIAKCQMVRARIEKVREMRLASKKAATRKKADFPQLFDEVRQPTDGGFIIVPRHSSELRRYIPIGFETCFKIAGDANLIIPDASLYHFGILTSRMHNAWMRAVCGRLKSDYRYSKDIVYNNFIWPDQHGQDARATSGTGVSPVHEKITAAAQAILDIRERYLSSDPSCTLAILYNPETMPPDLVKAHAALDALVDKAYGRSFASDTDRVAHLFNLYAKYGITKSERTFIE